MSAGYFTTRANAAAKAMADFERVQSFVHRRATDGEGRPVPLTHEQEQRIERAAIEMRNALQEFLR